MTSSLRPDTLLVRSRDVVVRLGHGDQVAVMAGEEPLETTPHALAILLAFAQPRTVADVLATTGAGPEPWLEAPKTILELARIGALRTPGEEDENPRGYARPPMHVAMLDDQARTRGFLDALRAVVRPGDKVVDIGTGSGILAATAARAGAARVYAIESSAIADTAARVFALNGVDANVTVVRGFSTTIDLPERADVLVTEMIGNDPLDEHLLEIVADAKKRLLVPGGRIVPSAIEIVAVPVEVPQRTLERHTFTRERVDAWRTAYGIDLEPLLDIQVGAAQPIMVRPRHLLAWPQVGPATSLTTIDLTQPFEEVQFANASFTVDVDVARLGVVLAFRATLAPGIVLSTVPKDSSAENSWRYPLWPAFDRLAVPKGTRIMVDWHYQRGTTTLRLSGG